MTHLKRTLVITALASLRYPLYLAVGFGLAWAFVKAITHGFLPGAI